MKQILSLSKFFLFSLLILAFFISLSAARTGPGLVWNTESETLSEGETRCLTYSLYNPWEDSGTFQLSVSGSLVNLSSTNISASHYLIGSTMRKDALPILVCFHAPRRVYPQDCILGYFFCKTVCPKNLTSYSGEIQASLISNQSLPSFGSSTTLSISAPLDLKIACTSTSSSIFEVVVLIFLVLCLVLAIVFRSKFFSFKRLNV